MGLVWVFGCLAGGFLGGGEGLSLGWGFGGGWGLVGGGAATGRGRARRGAGAGFGGRPVLCARGRGGGAAAAPPLARTLLEPPAPRGRRRPHTAAPGGCATLFPQAPTSRASWGPRTTVRASSAPRRVRTRRERRELGGLGLARPVSLRFRSCAEEAFAAEPPAFRPSAFWPAGLGPRFLGSSERRRDLPHVRAAPPLPRPAPQASPSTR